MIQRLQKRISNVFSSGRQIEHMLVRLRLPKSLCRLFTKAIRVALSPGQFWIRFWAAKKLTCFDSQHLANLRDQGVTFARYDEFELGAEVQNACIKIIEKRLDRGKMIDEVGRRHLINLLRPEDILENLCFIDFAIHDRLIALISHYLKTVPLLTDVQIWWSTSNDTEIGSQQFHFDQEDYSTLRLFIHLTDVDMRAGPLTYFDKNCSQKIRSVCRQTKLDRWASDLRDSSAHQV